MLSGLTTMTSPERRTIPWFCELAGDKRKIKKPRHAVAISNAIIPLIKCGPFAACIPDVMPWPQCGMNYPRPSRRAKAHNTAFVWMRQDRNLPIWKAMRSWLPRRLPFG